VGFTSAEWTPHRHVGYASRAPCKELAAAHEQPPSEFTVELTDTIGGSEESCNSKSVFVVFILTLFRPTLTRTALCANAAPGMIPLSASASSTSATSALRLKGAAHFIAIDGTRKSQGHGASLYFAR
jgi:hypothetical protein